MASGGGSDVDEAAADELEARPVGVDGNAAPQKPPPPFLLRPLAALWQNQRLLGATFLFGVAQLVFGLWHVETRWQWLLVYGFVFVTARGPEPTDEALRRPGVWFFSVDDPQRVGGALLSLSTATAWCMGHDVTRAMVAGGEYGVLGGVAECVRYITLPVVAVTAYALRTRSFVGSTSLTEIIHVRYGRLSAALFQVIVCYRLFTLVFLNAGAAADFYGARHTLSWWCAAGFAVGIPLLAVLQGGMRTAVFADALLGFVALGCAASLAAVVLGASSNGAQLLRSSSDWHSLRGGGDKLIVVFLEGLSSYGFMDPSLTDRAFLATPRTMLGALFFASLLGAAKVVAASLIGVAAAAHDTAGSAVCMAQQLGRAWYQVATLFVLTSSLSSLNATLASAGKLWALELGRMLRGAHIARPDGVGLGAVWSSCGAAILVAGASILPLLSGAPGAVAAIVSSGTPVLGLGWPLFYAAARKSHTRHSVATPLVFLLPLGFSVALGVAYQVSTTPPADVLTAKHLPAVDFGLFPDVVRIGSGPASRRLAWTVLAIGVSGMLCGAAALAEEILSRRSIINSVFDVRKQRRADAEHGDESADEGTARPRKSDGGVVARISEHLARATSRIASLLAVAQQAEQEDGQLGALPTRKVSRRDSVRIGAPIDGDAALGQSEVTSKLSRRGSLRIALPVDGEEALRQAEEDGTAAVTEVAAEEAVATPVHTPLGNGKACAWE